MATRFHEYAPPNTQSKTNSLGSKQLGKNSFYASLSPSQKLGGSVNQSFENRGDRSDLGEAPISNRNSSLHKLQLQESKLDSITTIVLDQNLGHKR